MDWGNRAGSRIRDGGSWMKWASARLTGVRFAAALRFTPSRAPETYGSRGLGLSVQTMLWAVSHSAGGYVADGPEEAVGVEPPYPFQGGELYVFETVPRTPSPNDLRFEQSDHGFDKRVVGSVRISV